MPGILMRDVIYHGEVTDLLLEEMRLTPAPRHWPDDALILPARGLVAMPGVVDVHVHFRDPGFTEKEDILSGARAAAAGGVTTVLCEPNTRPVIDTVAAVQDFTSRVQEARIPVAVYPKSALTAQQLGEQLVDIAALEPLVPAFSDDGEPVVNRDLLIEAFRTTGHVITAHCEETPRSAERVRSTLGQGPELARETELIQLHVDALARAGSGRLHVQHVSLAASLEPLRYARKAGLPVTAEVTPHHLLLCAEDIPADRNADWKMNPPLRSRADMLALRAALAAGLIDIVATDHAPHTGEEKSRGWDHAPFGCIGLETALPACLSLVREGALSFTRLTEAMSLAPARLLPAHFQSGMEGNVTLVDLDAAWTVDPDHFYSRARNCPFAGRRFTGKPVITIAGGQLVYTEGRVQF